MKKAFTLVEILVATFIFAITVFIAFSAFYSATSFQSKTTAVRETTQAARNLMETISRDIRLADSGGIATGCNIGVECSNLQITKNGVTKTYSFDAVSYQANLDSIGITSGVYVDNLSFAGIDNNEPTDGKADGVMIRLTIKEKQQSKLTEKGIITLNKRVYRRGYKP
ncbi:MAG: prepilin-type N-terminal cleavage/methylation domain-containing protein [Candidatus Berkelbacteria bacterium]|nr:prepilin-type N-terminal cleavage/methylation domain-containing protein [Candidatus Berkelbacteria bacterium]